MGKSWGYDQISSKTAVHDENEEKIQSLGFRFSCESNGSKNNHTDTDIQNHDELVSRFFEKKVPKKSGAAISNSSNCADHGQKTIVCNGFFDIGLVISIYEEDSTGC